MRRNIKNDKVIKAITIGLATMIAATSAPVDALATEKPETPATTETPETPETPAAPVVDPVDAAKAEALTNGTVVTAESLDTPAPEVIINGIGAAAQTIKPADESIAAGLAGAYKDLNTDGLKNTDLADALTQLQVTEQNLETVAENLDVPEKLEEQKKSEAVYLENSDKDDNKKDRLQFGVSRNEDGSVKPDENGNPIIEDGEAKVQLSGQYGSNGRSIQGDYQSGMEAIQKAINLRTEGKEGYEDKVDEQLKIAGDYLADAKTKLGESEKKLGETIALYNASADAYAQLKESLDKVDEEIIKGAIASTEAAQAKLEFDQSRLDEMSAVKDKYYSFIEAYYKSRVNQGGVVVYDENGKVDAVKTGEANPDGGKKGFGNWNKGRELLKVLVTENLERNGATEIKMDINKQIAPEDQGPDSRCKYFEVTYTDKNGKSQTKLFNIIYKDAGTIKYNNVQTQLDDKDKLHMENGPIYVSEIIPNADGTFSYTPYNPDSTEFLDNYKALSAVSDAAKAKEEVEDLQARLRKLQQIKSNLTADMNYLDKLLTIYGEKLENAQVAYNNSKQSLKDFQDVYDQMFVKTEEDDRETDEDLGGDLVDQPTGGDTPGGTTDDGAGTGGGTVIDGGDVSVTIPGGFTLPAGLLDAVAPTGGTASGVLGVRTGGGTEADEGGAADSRTNVAPRADFSTVNKVLGSRQNKDNSQIVKKIKDNEIPLAEIPNMDDEVTMNWMWLLIIFLLGATGKKMYDEYKKKKEAEEAAKINK